MNVAAPIAAGWMMSGGATRHSRPTTVLWQSRQRRILTLYFLHTPGFMPHRARGSRYEPCDARSSCGPFAWILDRCCLARAHSDGTLPPFCFHRQVRLFARCFSGLLAASALRGHRHAACSSSLGDQHLAGLLMVVACPLSYLIAAMLITVDLIGPRAANTASSGRTAMRRDASPARGGHLPSPLVLAVVPSAALSLAWSGVYNVAASSGHWPPVKWFLAFGMHSSVRTHAIGMAPPGSYDDDQVTLGAGHFHSGLRLLPWRAGRADRPDRARHAAAAARSCREVPGGATASCSGSSRTASSTPACRLGPRSSATTKSGRWSRF